MRFSATIDVTESTRAISHMCVWQAFEAQPQFFRLLSSFFNVNLLEFFNFPYRMFAIFQHTLSLVFRSVTRGVCCWCCKRGAFWLFFVARAISIRVWRQKQFILNICYTIEPFTEHSEWATSFSCPVLTSLWHCPELLLILGHPLSWIVPKHSRNSTLFSHTWSMWLHHKVSSEERSIFASPERSQPFEVFQGFELERSTPYCMSQQCTQGQQSPLRLCPLPLFSSDSSLHCHPNLLRGRLLEIIVTTLATPMGHLKTLPASVELQANFTCGCVVALWLPAPMTVFVLSIAIPRIAASVDMVIWSVSLRVSSNSLARSVVLHASIVL